MGGNLSVVESGSVVNALLRVIVMREGIVVHTVVLW